MSVPVRLWFKKDKSAVYISHLDVNRTMIRVIRRAGIPVWYTEGFNKHAYITFPSPLPLFAAGDSEPMDFKLDGDMSLSEIKQRMNDACPMGLSVVDVTLPVLKAVDISNAKYTVHLLFEGMNAKQSAEILSRAKKADSVVTMKRTKKGQKEIELKQYINGLRIGFDDDTAMFEAILPCGNALNIGPALIIEAICQKFDVKLGEYDITRNLLLDKNMKPFA